MLAIGTRLPFTTSQVPTTKNKRKKTTTTHILSNILGLVNPFEPQFCPNCDCPN
jgi:molybdenum cofactor biosynthesis enzyme MoaA